jgi:uncharacterized protein
MRAVAAFAVLLGLCAGADAAEAKKRLLLVTHSGGFIHDSVYVAEQVLKDVGPKHGFAVTCYRFTGDPDARVKKRVKQDGKDVEVETTALARYSEDFRKRTGVPVEREHCGRINAETLKNFDVVLFFTTGSHRDKRPPLKIRVEDPKHAAAAGFTDGMEFTDEYYIFTENPYNRDRLHIILSLYKESFKPGKGARADGDYAVAWCQQVGKGRSFYTGLGHRKEVWQDERFQQHLIGGLKWALGMAPGDATPSGKLAGK